MQSNVTEKIRLMDEDRYIMGTLVHFRQDRLLFFAGDACLSFAINMLLY